MSVETVSVSGDIEFSKIETAVRDYSSVRDYFECLGDCLSVWRHRIFRDIRSNLSHEMSVSLSLET